VKRSCWRSRWRRPRSSCAVPRTLVPILGPSARDDRGTGSDAPSGGAPISPFIKPTWPCLVKSSFMTDDWYTCFHQAGVAERSVSDGPRQLRGMERRPAVRSRLSIFVATTAALLSVASLAIAEPPAGTKNFNAPGAAPNYFSNESGPVMHQPAPLPAAPQAPARTSRETEEPEGQVEAAAAKAERQVVR